MPDISSSPHAFRDYQLYSIWLQCQIPLSFPERRLPGQHGPDVTLSLTSDEWFARFAGELANIADTGAWYQYVPLADGSDFVRWRDLFEFVISPDGRSIACRRLERATAESFQTYLLGQVLSFALVKQCHEPLHATAVVVEGKAVAFLGKSGYGKSTLASAFVQAGQQVLTDDLLLIRKVEGTWLGFPGPSRLKLLPEVARRFLPRQAEGTLMNPDGPKLIIPLEPGQSCSEPTPVQALYALDEAQPGISDVSLTPLTERESLIELIRSTFNYRLVNSNRLHQQFLAAQRLVPSIPVKRLTYPRRFEILPQVLDTIRADVASLEAPCGALTSRGFPAPNRNSAVR
jgi:hypothetical protein